MYQLIKPTERR